MYFLHLAILRVLMLHWLYVVSRITQCLPVVSQQAVLVAYLVRWHLIIISVIEQTELKCLNHLLSMPPWVIQQQYITLAAQNQAHRCALLILPMMLQIFVCCGFSQPCAWACQLHWHCWSNACYSVLVIGRSMANPQDWRVRVVRVGIRVGIWLPLNPVMIGISQQTLLHI